MKGLDKFKKEIQTELDRIKDDKKKKFYEAQMEQIINHINEVCDKEYDDLLAQDHKSFRRMWTFVVNNAKEFEVNGCSFVSDPVVYGWVDEYVGLDDKAEVEKEEKEKAKSKEKVEQVKKSVVTKTTTTTTTTVEQLSIFDIL